MKQIFTVFIVLAVSIPVLAQELHYEGKAEVKTSLEKEEAVKELATALGIVYVGMPKEDLYETGFTEYLQKDYRQEGNEEWITFSDWTTEESGDRVTFHLIDGKVKSWGKFITEPENKRRQSEI